MNTVFKDYSDTNHNYYYQSRRVIGGYQRQNNYNNYQEVVAVAVRTASYDARQNTIIFILLNAIIFLLVVLGITKFSGFNLQVAGLQDFELPGRKAASTEFDGEYRQPTKRFLFIREHIKKMNPRANAEEMARVVIRESALAGYDPFFILSIISSESTFRPAVVSNKGAIGLMQLLPSTAQYIAKKESIAWQGAGSLYTSEYNIRLGIRYVQYLEHMFNGNIRLALMAYNWGPGNVRKAVRGEHAVLPQVAEYAHKILKRQSKLQAGFQIIEAA